MQALLHLEHHPYSAAQSSEYCLTAVQHILARPPNLARKELLFLSSNQYMNGRELEQIESCVTQWGTGP